MTDISKLRDLLERVKSATGPDREIDGEIMYLIDASEFEMAHKRAQEPSGCSEPTATEDAKRRFSPYYTSSIDAAVALCERVLQPQWIRTDIWRGQDASVGLLPNEIPGDVTGARAPTLPLALCAATLRAKIAMLEKEAA